MLGHLTAQFAILRVPAHRGFRNLLLARLISALGTWTAFFAVRIALYQQTHSAWWVSILLFCELVPGVILGVAVGPLIDRWSRKRMMILSDLGGAVAFGVLPFIHSPAGICALCRGAALRQPFSGPSCYSAIPNLVAEDALIAANTLDPGRREPRDAGRPRARGRRRRRPRLRSASTGSTRQLHRLRARCCSHRKPAAVGRARADRPDALEGGALRIRRSSATTGTCRRSSSSGAGRRSSYAGINVAEIVLTKDAYGTGNVGFGIFVAFSAAGIVIGNFAAGWIVERLTVYGGYRASFLITAVGVAICAVSPGIVARLRRGRHLRCGQRHRPRLQPHADPADRLRRPAGPDLRRAR